MNGDMEIDWGGSLAGRVLAAEPGLLDPNFHQTLVYLTHHGDEGAMGFVMNRPLGQVVGDVVTDQLQLPAELKKVPLLHGGPVKTGNLIVAVFQRGEDDEDLECHLVSEPGEAVAALGKKRTWVRAFVGHSGWSEGQLEKELGEGAWKICPAHTVLLDERARDGVWQCFAGEDQRWRQLMKFLPRDPGMN